MSDQWSGHAWVRSYGKDIHWLMIAGKVKMKSVLPGKGKAVSEKRRVSGRWIMAWKLLVTMRCAPKKCSSGQPVSMGLSYGIVSYFLLIRRWGWLLLRFSGLIFFPYLTGVTRSKRVLSRLLVIHRHKLHRSISHSEKGGGRGKRGWPGAQD